MEVTLRAIDRSNWDKCCRLTVSAAQRAFVASNAYSLAQAAYEPDTWPMGIFCEGELVGFLMWGFDSEHCVWEVYRLMVDEAHQGRGIGRAALQKLLELVRKKHGSVLLHIGANPDNAVALALYESMGFRRNGQNAYGEVVLELPL